MKKIKYLTYRIKWHLAPFFNFKSPVHIDLEITNLCNQSCLSCWHSQKELPFKLSRMTLFQVKDFLNSGQKMGVKSVKYNWRGEASLNEKLPQMIYSAKELNYTDIMMNTNGIMSINRLKKILDSGIDTMIISVDSFDEEIYCKIHNCDKYNFFKLMKIINYLKKEKEENRLKTTVKFNFHINKYNKKDKSIFSNQMLYPFKFIIRNTMKREGQDITVNNKERKRKKICPHMKRRLTISASGKVFPCCVAYLEPEDIRLDNDLEKAWNSEKRKTLIKNYKKGIYTDSCINCTSEDIWK